MYSVLIQSKKTLDSFEQFTPIFTDAVSQSKIGICQWMEAGKTVETALPELINLVAGKEEWRAVIVRLEDDAPMAAFPAAPDNPYDFLINAQPADGVQESPVPLVRLTQMLGGVPAPQVRFERQLVEQTGKPKQVVYLPSVDPEDEERYRELSERYHLNAKPPAEILLLSVRMLEEDQKPEVRRAFVQPLETRSSEFWKRNAYPGRCRFACFGMRRQGVMERNEDLFRFWTCVMLLSTNDLDAGTLQGGGVREPRSGGHAAFRVRGAGHAVPSGRLHARPRQGARPFGFHRRQPWKRSRLIQRPSAGLGMK